MKGIIIEGIVGSGKTSIVKYVRQSLLEEKPNSSVVFLSEHYTQRMLEHLSENNALTPDLVKKHITQIIHTLTQFQNMLEQSKFAQNPRGSEMYVVLERFIITHFLLFNSKKGYSKVEIKKHFHVLSDLGFSQIVLTIPKKQIKKRALSTIEHRNKTWNKYLTAKGNELEIERHYIKLQNTLLSCARQYKNQIPTEILEVKNDKFKKYAEIIFKKYLH